MFDHRIGVLTLIDCEIKNTNTTTSTKYIFTLGNTTRKDPVFVNISGCTILANTTKSNVFETFSGQPCTVNVENTTINSVGRILYAPDSNGKNPQDVFNFTNCTIHTTVEGALFNLKYDNLTINLNEVYVPTGNSYESATGTVNIAKGQTVATVEGGGYMITAPKVKLETNLTLYTDFTLNIWIPTSSTILSIAVNGEAYPLSDKEKLQITMRRRHGIQLSYYAKAVASIFGKYPKAVEVYSLHFGDSVDVSIQNDKYSS
jgi:hypothetical protein